MSITEPVSVAFVLRFWLERREIECALPFWRGVIEHIPSGERHFFDKIEDLADILSKHLNNLSAT